MTLFQMLKSDHRKVVGMLKKIEKSEDERERLRMFKSFTAEIMPHLRAEEALIYPLLKREEESRDLAFEAIEEHELALHVVHQMEEAREADEVWCARLTVLMEVLDHHIEEEEGEIFSAMRAEFDSRQLKQLAVDFEEFKRTFQAGASRQRRNLRAVG